MRTPCSVLWPGAHWVYARPAGEQPPPASAAAVLTPFGHGAPVGERSGLPASRGRPLSGRASGRRIRRGLPSRVVEQVHPLGVGEHLGRIRPQRGLLESGAPRHAGNGTAATWSIRGSAPADRSGSPYPAAPGPVGGHVKTTVLPPCTRTRSVRCRRTARASTTVSRSRPRRTRSATSSRWETGVTA